jgi:hypothetical protein
VEIYIGNIPKGTRAAEVKKLMRNSVKENIFTGLFNRIVNLGRLDKDVMIKIVKYKPKNGSNDYRYGRVNMKSERLAQASMGFLEGRALRGNRLQIRPFVTRSTDNDRRRPNWRDRDWKEEHRRVNERRQS